MPPGSQSKCLHASLLRVPLPIICQNFILEFTGFINVRFTNSGMSTPVSSISTEIAILGRLSFLNLFNSLSALSIFESITWTSFPSYCGYMSLNVSANLIACLWVMAKTIDLPGSCPDLSDNAYSINSSHWARSVSLFVTFLSKSVPSKLRLSGSIPFSLRIPFSSSVRSIPLIPLRWNLV